MEDATETVHCAANAVCDVLGYLGNVSYAILPREVAHQLGDLQKALWGGVRSLVSKEIDWIDARVAGGDQLREQWRRGPDRQPQETAAPID